MLSETVAERVARIWLPNERGTDFAPLQIDSFLQSLSPPRRLRLAVPLDVAKRLARRAMEVACCQIEDRGRMLPPETSADFGALEANARRAREALFALIRHLDPGAREGHDLEISLVSAQAGLQNGDAHALHANARSDGVTLWAALEIAGRLEEAAARKDAQIRKGRENPGKPDQREFTSRLAECWIFMVGKAPGTNPVFEKNPFLQFVTAAWVDAFGHHHVAEDPAFIGGLNGLTLTPAEIAKIREAGPSWMKGNF